LGSKLFEMGKHLINYTGSSQDLENVTTEDKNGNKLVLLSTNPKLSNHWWPLSARQEIERMFKAKDEDEQGFSVCRRMLLFAIDDLEYWARNNANTAMEGEQSERLKACFGKRITPRLLT
jgi:hypothetical protein